VVLELTRPIVQAPMAGGPSTPALAAAVSEAGGLGFLAAGYRTPEAVREDVRAVRGLTGARVGVNVFLPGPPGDDEAVRRYAAELRAEADRWGVELGEPRADDDAWEAKVAVCVEERVPVVSFTFGLPRRDVVAALHDAGALVLVTVTTPEEAVAARDVGADALVVQGVEAGGHRGGFRDDDGEVLTAGGPTALTRAFSGRRARGLVNRFLAEHSAAAPSAYPQVHHLTTPLRAAARAAGDAGGVNLWAGQAHRLVEPRPAGELVRRIDAHAALTRAAAR
jgi:nitronate monooxygenase